MWASKPRVPPSLTTPVTKEEPSTTTDVVSRLHRLLPYPEPFATQRYHAWMSRRHQRMRVQVPIVR